MKRFDKYGLWIASEICYYLGLVCAALFLPALTIVLWLMSLVDKADPNYWYLFIVWRFSVEGTPSLFVAKFKKPKFFPGNHRLKSEPEPIPKPLSIYSPSLILKKTWLFRKLRIPSTSYPTRTSFKPPEQDPNVETDARLLWRCCQSGAFD